MASMAAPVLVKQPIPSSIFDGKKPRTGGFLKQLSQAQVEEYLRLETQILAWDKTVLFSEQERSDSLFQVVEGQVKLIMNSSCGRRVAVGLATPGDLLDLSAVMSCQPHNLTAEAVHTCTVAMVPSARFRAFITRHSQLSAHLIHEISAQQRMVCEALRLLGLDTTASRKVARLLLQWCTAHGTASGEGARLKFSMTHEEIGEFIGATRETVSRVLSDLRERRVVVTNGATLMVPHIGRLEMMAMA